jgi:hypothetical protein
MREALHGKVFTSVRRVDNDPSLGKARYSAHCTGSGWLDTWILKPTAPLMLFGEVLEYTNTSKHEDRALFETREGAEIASKCVREKARWIKTEIVEE